MTDDDTNVSCHWPKVSSARLPMAMELLRLVQAGQINQFAVVWLGANGTTYGTWVSDRGEKQSHGTLALLGAIEDLKLDVLNLHNQQQSDTR